jgi:HAD superfamily hydrolase (TIGR01509 family)
VDRDRLVVHCTLEVAKGLLGKTLNPDQISWGLHETDTIRRLSRQLSRDRSEQALDAYTDCLKANLKMWEVFPGIPGLLERLGESGKQVALVTSVPNRTLVSEALEGLSLKRYFVAVVTGEDVTRNKPDPEGIQMALKRMEVPPNSVIMVGDSASDIQAGRNAGVITGAALWGSKAMRDLWGPIASQARPDFEFQTVAELNRFLFPARV